MEGVYEFMRITMGMKNSAGYFQDQMHRILEGKMGPVVYLESQKADLLKIPDHIRKTRRLDLTNHGILQYLDDTLIYAPTEALLFKLIELFLDRMYLFGIFLKPKNCILWPKETVFLGWRMSSSGVSVEPDK